MTDAEFGAFLAEANDELAEKQGNWPTTTGLAHAVAGGPIKRPR